MGNAGIHCKVKVDRSDKLMSLWSHQLPLILYIGHINV